jgi:RHS repeat-associated protein
MIGRVLDDGSSQIYRYEYNSRGNTSRYIDPVGRETLYEYAANGIDLLSVKQKNAGSPGGYELLTAYTYNSQHSPITVVDPAVQTVTYTYNAEGQVSTLTTPERASISEDRAITYSYDVDGYLETVEAPLNATTSYTYDSYGRVDTVTQADDYALTFDYDDLDRPTKVTYPDASFVEVAYERLGPVRTRDRLGRWSHMAYDALGRLTATTDPLGRTVTQQWCSCNNLDALIDANGNRTGWERDIQGRVTKETRPNGTEWLYEYEDATSRVKTVTDPKEQLKTYSYFADDNVEGLTYTNEEHQTPDVTYAYDAVFDRISTLQDGTGTTAYGYHPIGSAPSLGAGRLASIDGPHSNDILTYEYDELGHMSSRAINGVADTYVYDGLGRVTAVNNTVGSFSYQYDAATRRLKTVSYPNGQTTNYDYFANIGDRRLKEIHHQKPGGAALAKFNYTYDAVGNILTWTQQRDTDPSKAYDSDYDAADQLRTADWRTTEQTPTVLKRYAYAYDAAGNRTVEQIDDAPVLSAYDNMNRLSSQAPGGDMRFAGSLSEAASVSIEGVPATVKSDDRFEGTASVGSGTNSVVVKAKDYSGNERTNTYDVSVSGSSKSFTYDANGNMTGDGTRSFEWDAENRLVKVTENSTEIASFSYDAFGRRSTKTVGAGTHTFVYDGEDVLEDRTSGSTVTYAHGPGVDRPLAKQSGAATSYFLADHLGSIIAETNTAGEVTLEREFDPYGAPLSGGTNSGYAYTGREWDSETSLAYHRARYYDPSLGKFLAEDPLRREINAIPFAAPPPYSYAENNPLKFTDPSGYLSCLAKAGLNFLYCQIWTQIILEAVFVPVLIWGCSGLTVATVGTGLPPCVIVTYVVDITIELVFLFTCAWFAYETYKRCKACKPVPKLPIFNWGLGKG